MGLQWQAQFFQTLLCAVSVSLSFRLAVNRDLRSEMHYQRAQHEIHQKRQNPATHVSPAPKEISLEKYSMFDAWNGQLGQSQQDAQEFAAKDPLNERSSVVGAPKMPQILQMDDPVVHSPGVQVSQRPLKVSWEKLPARSSQGPQHPSATQRLQTYVASSSRRRTSNRNNPVVHSQGVQVTQRPLTVFSGVLRNHLGGSSLQHPTATTTQRPQYHEANPYRRQPHQTNDPLVHYQEVHVPQRPLTDFSRVLGIQIGGSSLQHPTATTTQRPQYHEANTYRRQPHQTNNPLVLYPEVHVPQRPLTDFSGVLGIQLGGSSLQHPTATTTHRPHLYRRQRDLMNDPLVQSPEVLLPQKPLKMDFPTPAVFSEWGNLPSQFDDGQQHPPKPQPSEIRTPSWHRPPAQSFQEPQLNATKTLPKDQKSELQQPVTTQSVHAVCGEKSLQLTVKMDFLGTGDLINPADVTLGGCAPTVLDESQQELLFETALHECGGTAQLFEDVQVYTFSLIYITHPIEESPIVKTNDATVNITCHYARFHNVSSNSLRPTWIPYQSSRLSDQVLDFSLRLMTDDWRYERPSTKYFLGDMINIEALVYADNRVPLRIFVEGCVAAVNPDSHSGTSYVLIEKHGCLSDSKLMASRSQFMPRIQDEKLQMQIEAFRFADESHDSFYITCILRAVVAASASESSHKACHYNMENDRWNSADGNDEVCSCCNADQCLTRRARAAKEINGRRVKLGPITVQEKTT